MNSFPLRRVRGALESLGVTVEPLASQMEDVIRETLGSDGSAEPIWMVQRRKMGLGTNYRVLVGEEGRIISYLELEELFKVVHVEWDDFLESIAQIA